MGSHTYYLYKQPLGFHWEDNYVVLVSTPGRWSEADSETLRQLLPALRADPAIEYAHGLQVPLFRNWQWSSTFSHDGIETESMQNALTAGGPQALGMKLIEGRWFEEADLADNRELVTINRRLRDELFPEGNALGADITQYDDDRDDQKPTVVIGVFEDFRQWGELSELRNYIMGQMDLSGEDGRANSILIHPTNGLSGVFEQQLQAQIEALAPAWRVRITSAEKMRGDQIRSVMTPIVVSTLLASFLMLMVAFGLFGVLWQNVTRRTDELGLRRALGATRRSIYRQIINEMILVAGIAVVAGSLLAVQLPMLGTFREINWQSTTNGLIGSIVVLGFLCAVCALYPAWLASRRSPAEALHYE